MANLTGEDLEFLRTNKVALRFQHTAYHESFRQKGMIVGDAYALGYEGPWGKDPAKFQQRLGQLVKRVFVSQVASNSDEGTFVLLKDVEGADKPVAEKGSYDLFSPVGAFTRFEGRQSIGEIPIAHADLTARIGANSREFANVDKVATALTDQVVNRVQKARTNTPEARFPHGVEDTRSLLSQHLSSDGRDFGFDGTNLFVKQPHDPETPESRRFFESLKALEKKGALSWGFQGEKIVLKRADLSKIAEHFADPVVNARRDRAASNVPTQMAMPRPSLAPKPNF